MKNLKKIFSSNPILVNSPEEMRELGEAVADYIEAGDVIGLVGDLGAGKTHFTQGVLQGLGQKEPIVSPSFSLVNEYNDINMPCAHFDFYRMAAPEEAHSIAWEDYLSSGRVLIVEWADRFDGILMPDDTIWFVIKYNDTYGRNVFCAQV